MYEHLKVAIIGDYMLDEWLEPKEVKVSPEAPVLDLVNPTLQCWGVGGAGNLALSVIRLGAQAYLYGSLGDGDYSRQMKDAFRKSANVDGLQTEPGYKLIRKSRYMYQGHPLFRVSSEYYALGLSVDGSIDIMVDNMRSIDFDAIIISDYDKGTMNEYRIDRIITHAKANNIPVFVDPKFRNFWFYEDCTVIMPNRREANAALPLGPYEEKAWRIANKLGCKYCVITLGEQGIMVSSLPDKNGHTEFCPICAWAVDAVDVTGAGDTVTAVLTLEYLRTGDIMDAARLANYAASLTVQKHGTAQVRPKDLLDFPRRVVSGKTIGRAFEEDVEYLKEAEEE